MPSGRPKGVKNKPKEFVDPQLAQLADIAMDMNLDTSVREDAAQALAKALTPPVIGPPATPQRKGFIDPTTNKWICACDWFSAEGACINCKAERDANPPKPVTPPAAPKDDADLSAELDAIEKELFG